MEEFPKEQEPEVEKTESEERFERLKLEIEPPDQIHGNWKISFECGNLGTCAAYNSSIDEVARKNRTPIFHQSGVTPKGEHEPGYHMWEFWLKTDEAKLQDFILKVQEMAEERFKEHQESGMHEYWKEKRGK